MTPELKELLRQLDAQAEQARRFDSAILMDGCYEAAKAELIKTHEEFELLKANIRNHVEAARGALQIVRTGP